MLVPLQVNGTGLKSAPSHTPDNPAAAVGAAPGDRASKRRGRYWRKAEGRCHVNVK